MTRKAKCYLRATIIIICIAVISIVALLATTPRHWKLFSQTINNNQLALLAQENNNFVGMYIEDVLELITKDNKCYIFTQESICMGKSYEEVIAHYPEMELTPPRNKLYCVAVCSSMAKEEIYPRGFFVNAAGIVTEPHIPLSIYW